jgi:hypothetical protein
MELRLKSCDGSAGSQIEVPPAYPPERQAPVHRHRHHSEATPGSEALPYQGPEHQYQSSYQAPERQYQSSYPGQPSAPPYFASQAPPDAGQEIANVFGSVLGGIGGGFLAGGLFGRGYGYNPGWDGYNLGYPYPGYNTGYYGYNPGYPGYNVGYRGYNHRRR